MPLEAIVGQDATQVGIAVEDDAIHVEHFALQPAGDRPEVRDGRHRRILVGRNLDADAVVPRDAEQVIGDLEPVRTFRIVDAGDFHQLLVMRHVAQRDHGIGQVVARDNEGQFVGMIDGFDQHRTQQGADFLGNPFGVHDLGCRMAHINAQSSRSGGSSAAAA